MRGATRRAGDPGGHHRLRSVGSHRAHGPRTGTDRATIRGDGAGAAAGAPPTIPGFEIGDCLGAGGMGTVGRATQLATRRPVALKLLSFQHKRARPRFEREVELSARLNHPHNAKTYTSGAIAGHHYYAMELVLGLPLDVYARGRSRREILELVRTVALAVQHAHQRGVIYRDLKPDNVLVDADGRPCVLDFGLAKSIVADDSERRDLTQDGAIAGTPAYMAPEQAAGHARDADTRTDVYALGAVLYELLTGRTPFEGYTTFEMLARIVELLEHRALDHEADLSWAAADVEGPVVLHAAPQVRDRPEPLLHLGHHVRLFVVARERGAPVALP